jgi:apolipoprotein N-acyltransferase
VLLFLPALPNPEKPTESAVSVQPNIPERDDWTEALARRTQMEMESLSLQAAFSATAPKPGLILWPEVPAPVYYLEDSPFRDRVNALAGTTQAGVLIGTVAHNERGAPLNAALMISAEGRPTGRYDKMFLVPFGEYIPFPFKGVLATIASEAGDFEPGTRVVVFDFGTQRIGAFICYESAFPGLVRRFTAAGATVLTNLSNDGYFGGAAAREQHLSLVRMRAAENRRWIVRSTNDGISASIDPAGRVVAVFPEFQATSGRLPFSFRNDLTFYVRYGDLFAWSCALLAAALLALSQLPGYHRS